MYNFLKLLHMFLFYESIKMIKLIFTLNLIYCQLLFLQKITYLFSVINKFVAL